MMMATTFVDSIEGEITVTPDHLVSASYDAVKRVLAERQWRAFRWPLTDDPDDAPIIVDMQTANVMVTIHDALSEANRVTFEDWVAMSRIHFAKMVAFCWNNVN